MELITVKDITKVFKKKVVLLDVNLTIEKGEIYGLIGNNGAGKTTLLRILCNLLQPTGGSIEFNDGAFGSKIKIGSLIEHPALYFDMSAYQNIKAKALSLGVKYSKQEIFDLLHTLKQSENLKNFSFFEVINHSEAYPLIFNNTKVEIGKTKKALLLYYEFLKHIAYKQSDYDNFDKIIQQVQDFCDNTIKFITNLPTLNSPQEIIRVGKDGDYIDDEGASKLTGISKTTLYEMAKNGLIEKESSQSYFVDSLNKYFKDKMDLVIILPVSYFLIIIIMGLIG